MGTCFNGNKKSKLQSTTKEFTTSRTDHNLFKTGEVYYLKHKEGIDFKQDLSGGRDKIELFFSLRCEKPAHLVYLQDVIIGIDMSSINNKEIFNFLGETEGLEEGSLNYHTTYIIDYFFERNQYLKLNINSRKLNTPLETIETTVGRIMGARSHTIEFPIEYQFIEDGKAFLVVHTLSVKEEVKNTMINFELYLSLSKFDDYFVIISNFNTSLKQAQRVYKSAEMPGNEIRFNCKNMNLNDICLGDKDKDIIFDFYSLHMGLIAKVVTTLNKISENNNIELYDESALLIGNCLFSFSLEKSAKFIEYLEQGLQVSLIIGVDYTASNEIPSNPSSLHYLYGREPNPYEQAIRSCGSIVAFYDYDQFFPVFGFGGILPGNNTPNHCFACNLQPDPNVRGVDGIINAYKNSLSVVRLDGPTYFSPLIKNVLDFVREETNKNDKGSVYYILLILTDGQIHDMEATRSIICEASKLPISIIIIGVGEADFSNMVELDGDNLPLKNKNGEKVERDIVQFVVFNEFKTDISQLAAEVLYEVPMQVEQYYRHCSFKGCTYSS